MNNLNTVLVEGLLVRDPEPILGHAAEISACRLAIANNRYFLKDGKWIQDTSYFSVSVFGKVAETCFKYLKKGRGIRVVGRLKQYKYQDPSSGYKRDGVSILAEHIEFQPERRTQEKLVEPELDPGLPHTRMNMADTYNMTPAYGASAANEARSSAISAASAATAKADQDTQPEPETLQAADAEDASRSDTDGMEVNDDISKEPTVTENDSTPSGPEAFDDDDPAF